MPRRGSIRGRLTEIRREPSIRAEWYERVGRATQRPMLFLALAIIPLIVVPLVLNLPAWGDALVYFGNWLVWMAFALELAVLTYLAPSRLQHLRTNWFDVVIVVVPFLRPLRVAHALRALRVISAGSRAMVGARAVFGRSLQFGLAACAIAVLTVAGIVALVEHNIADASIDNFPTALWWAAATVTTVGYGDTAPVTTEGRILGVALMLVGIGVFALITASVAAFFVEAEEDRAQASLREEVRRLESQVARLAAALERREH